MEGNIKEGIGMKRLITILLALSFIFVTACGKSGISESVSTSSVLDQTDPAEVSVSRTETSVSASVSGEVNDDRAEYLLAGETETIFVIPYGGDESDISELTVQSKKKVEYNYSTNNNLIAKLIYYDDELEERIDYTYNTDRKLVKELRTYYTGYSDIDEDYPYYSFSYEYDGDTPTNCTIESNTNDDILNLLSEEIMNPEAVVIPEGSIEYTYWSTYIVREECFKDAEGRINRIDYFLDEEKIYTLDISYDKAGNIASRALTYVQDESYDLFDNIDLTRYLYDDRGHEIVSIGEDMDGMSIPVFTENTYDENGNLSYSVYYPALTSYYTVTTYEYMDSATGEVVYNDVDHVEIANRTKEKLDEARSYLYPVSGYDLITDWVGDFDLDGKPEAYAVGEYGDTCSIFYVDGTYCDNTLGEIPLSDESEVFTQAFLADGEFFISTQNYERGDFTNYNFSVSKHALKKCVGQRVSPKADGSFGIYEPADPEVTVNGTKYTGMNDIWLSPLKYEDHDLKPASVKETTGDALKKSYSDFDHYDNQARTAIGSRDYVLDLQSTWEIEILNIEEDSFAKSDTGYVYFTYVVDFVPLYGYIYLSDENGKPCREPDDVTARMYATVEFKEIGDELCLEHAYFGKNH